VNGRAAAAGVLLLLAAGCEKHAPAPSQAPAPEAPAASTPSAVPADHLAPDELLPGDKTAFGVVLPRVLRVEGAFADVVFASGQVAVRPLATYFRGRLAEGSLRVGDEAATFEHVHAPSRPDVELSVHIRVAGPYTRVEVRDTTQKPRPGLPDDPARWRSAGLTPNGKLVDPLHME
jgi:hypothetical protein